MEDSTAGNILTEYDKRCDQYSDLAKQTETLLQRIVEENGLRVHSIMSRVKTRSSLENKLGKDDHEYSCLDEVTDLAGIRIITYFADEVDKVAEIVENQFEIDRKNSVDKRVALDPDRFGYLSLHYIAYLSPARLKLPEYKRFKDCKVEIQIRSILQHAWAEIEHDLGYKSKAAIPRDTRRSFARLAGMLEIVDQEFDRIRDSLEKYESEVPDRIEKSPEEVLVDKASLKYLIESSTLVNELDSRIAKHRNTTLFNPGDYTLDYMVRGLNYVELSTIASIIERLNLHGDVVVSFAANFMDSTISPLSQGISIGYLCYVIAAMTQSKDYMSSFLQSTISANTNNDGLATRIFNSYNSITGV